MKLGTRLQSNVLKWCTTGIMSKRVVVFGITLFLGVVSMHPALAAKRLPIGEALTTGMVEVRACGKNSISTIAVTLTKKTKEDIAVVIGSGTYFTPESKLETEGYWSSDEITFSFLMSAQCCLDVPVVKYVLRPGSAGTNTELFVQSPPAGKIPKLLDFMLKNSMSHEAKQVAVGIIENPNLSRDEIDGMYYKRHSNLLLYTEEAVMADDPIRAFMALKQIGVTIDVVKLYTEQVSLVHGLGSQDQTVRHFALTELGKLGTLDKTFVDSRDCKGALLRFLKHDNRSVRYRAVLGLEGETGAEVVRALLPLATDDSTVYEFPDNYGRSITRTIQGGVIKVLKDLRETQENDLVSLLESSDYKERLAGIGVFEGTQKEHIKAVLTKLSESDEYKQVRDAAEEALRYN